MELELILFGACYQENFVLHYDMLEKRPQLPAQQ